MTAPIINSIAGADLHITELVDPSVIEFRARQMADAINLSRRQYVAATKDAQKHIVDLKNWIADIIIETSAQGASLLEVHVIDPGWALFQRDKHGTCFIDVDEQGFLWPPIEVTFPADISSSTWRLAQCRPSTDLNSANVVLVFVDKVSAELREHYGPLSSNPQETRAEFIKRLVTKASNSPAFPGDSPIRFRTLLDIGSPHAFDPSDLSNSQLPASANQPHPPKARRNPDKQPSQNPLLIPPNAALEAQNKAIEEAMNGTDISIQGVLDAVRNVSSPPFGGSYSQPGKGPQKPLSGGSRGSQIGGR